MKILTITKNGVRPEVVETISLLVARIPWSERRQAMAEVTTRILERNPAVQKTFLVGVVRPSSLE